MCTPTISEMVAPEQVQLLEQALEELWKTQTPQFQYMLDVMSEQLQMSKDQVERAFWQLIDCGFLTLSYTFFVKKTPVREDPISYCI